VPSAQINRVAKSTFSINTAIFTYLVQLLLKADLLILLFHEDFGLVYEQSIPALLDF
jgi:hypothetical protein